MSHRDLRERSCGSRKIPNFSGNLKDYGQRFFQISQTGYFEIWRREITATYRDWKEDYKMETTWWLLPEHRHCNMLEFIQLCPWNIQNITCWIRDVMLVFIQHFCAYVKEMTTKHLPTMRFWSIWSKAKCKTHDTEIRMALKRCQMGVTFADPGVACINDTQSWNNRR